MAGPQPARQGREVTLDARERAATLILGQSVQPGKEEEYTRWQQQITVAASRYPGYLSSEVQPPTTNQPDWVVIYHFNTVERALNWLNSATRQEHLHRGAHLVDGPGTQQIIAPDEAVYDALVTVVVTHKIAPDKVDEFLAWQEDMVAAEGKYPGFCGSEMFRPIEGVQEDWIVTYRFDSAEHLDAWLVSEDRKALLDRADFSEFHLRTIDHPFGSWFTHGGQDSPPSSFKTTMAVWFGIYPTVVVIGLLGRHLHLPAWSDWLVETLACSFLMTYVMMPNYVNRTLDWWLHPVKNARQPATNVRGLLLILVATGLTALVVYLCTARIWTLPPP